MAGDGQREQHRGDGQTARTAALLDPAYKREQAHGPAAGSPAAKLCAHNATGAHHTHLVDMTRSGQVASGSCDTAPDRRPDPKNEPPQATTMATGGRGWSTNWGVAAGTRYLPARPWPAATRPGWSPDAGGPSRSPPPRSEFRPAAALERAGRRAPKAGKARQDPAAAAAAAGAGRSTAQGARAVENARSGPGRPSFAPTGQPRRRS